MNEPIKFLANVDAVQAGDDEIRLALAVLNTAADRAAAVTMVAMRNRLLHVSAYLQKQEDPLVEFRCAIAQLKAAVQISPRRPPVIKLDVPASDGINALRLVGYDEEVIRFEVCDEGDKPVREKKRKAKDKTPFGALWEELLHRNMGFEHIPVINAALEAVRSSSREDPHQLMRKVFGVQSLSKLIGPDEINARFPHSAVTAMVKQARAKVESQQSGDEQKMMQDVSEFY